ncbi:unnamed protein product [Rhizophagus irregularis]|uniref:F-box domain-containing protein n=2 Tax=Rhizophagus irregularis TaxID=588596 RepID=A0A915YUZ8_9GLOM|nr:unnamed protein product [Rhizophagus irregularis]CAB5344025.1 unnamed protein product [Rhizophagus irregularis]CAB5380058.1 unnamed protein product [Rhizophagus irregularis]
MERLNIDCLILIFNELRTDKKSLHSCLLVNKVWCHLVVPILWGKYPWYVIDRKESEKLINVIISQLSSSSRKFLSENNVSLSSTILSKPLTFNYVSLCKFPGAENVSNIINIVNNYDFTKRRDLLEQEIYKLFISQCKNIKELSWETSQPLSLFPGALTCFSQLHSLRINMNIVSSNNLHEMAKICKDLNELIVNKYSQDTPGLISLIDAQRNLKSISFASYYIKKEREGTYEELSNVLARKGCTINNLYSSNLVGVISHSFLSSFINLKELTIYQYDDYKSEKIQEFQQYLAISKFPGLQSLKIGGVSCFKELAMLIEKTEGNLSYVYIDMSNKDAESTGMVIKAIADNCPKIEYLSTYLGPKDLIYVKPLLLHCSKLSRLRLKNLYENNNIGDELLDILTSSSPLSLNNIKLSGGWKYSINSIERFFESYRGRKLLEFGIKDNIHEDNFTIEHIKIIRKYINEGVIGHTNL